MAEQHDPHGRDVGGGDDYRYLGPYPGEAPQVGPSFVPQPPPEALAPPFLAGPATPAGQPAVAVARNRSLRPGAVIGIAALTAVLIGGGAGYGGARLAQQPDAAAPPASSTTKGRPSTTDPTTEPSDPPTQAPSGSGIDAVGVSKRVLPSTVMITVGRSTGSGFVLDGRGRIMTNNHVVAGVAGGASIRVEFADGRRQKAKLVGRSPSYDIAVIKVKASSRLRPVTIGNSSRTQVGESVLAVGSPLGLPGTVTQGIVSARNRPVVVKAGTDADAPTAYIDAIQTDAPINPGNSGGPLVDRSAKIIGVNSAILTMGSSQGPTGNIGLGFAIPIDQAKAIGNQLIKKGRATYPVLGANVQNASGGVEVTSVERSGPASKAGLRRGDLITRVEGTRVSAMEELIVNVRTRRPGQQITLDFARGSRRSEARVTLGSRVG